MSKILWNEQFKIRMSQALKSRDKHEVAKLLLVRMLIRKHKSEKQYIRIYTEFEISEGIITDVYFENYKNKEKISYELQENMSKNIIEKKIEKYKSWTDPFCTTDLIIVPLKELPEDIEGIKNKLKEYIV